MMTKSFRAIGHAGVAAAPAALAVGMMPTDRALARTVREGAGQAPSPKIKRTEENPRRN
jgi:hypothetical protein